MSRHSNSFPMYDGMYSGMYYVIVMQDRGANGKGVCAYEKFSTWMQDIIFSRCLDAVYCSVVTEWKEYMGE